MDWTVPECARIPAWGIAPMCRWRTGRTLPDAAIGQRIYEAGRWVATAVLRLQRPLVRDDGAFVGVPGLPS
jgi:hypothetical protein